MIGRRRTDSVSLGPLPRAGGQRMLTWPLPGLPEVAQGPGGGRLNLDEFQTDLRILTALHKTIAIQARSRGLLYRSRNTGFGI